MLVAMNVAVFLYQIFLPQTELDAFVMRYAAIPLEFRRGANLPSSPGLAPFWTLFTSMFLHGGWLHLIGNMLYLWIFGSLVEEKMKFRFLLFYLLCGLAAVIVQIYTNFRSDIPILGASGAIAGVLAAALRIEPRAKIAVLVPIFYIFRSVVLPAWLVLSVWFLLQVAEVLLSPQKNISGPAYFAHIAGFLAGFLLMPIFLSPVKRKSR